MSLTIRDVLKQKPQGVPSIKDNTSVKEAVEIFAQKSCRAAVVTDDGGHLCGLVSEHDLVRAMGEAGVDGAELKVSTIMSLDLIVATPSMPIQDAMKLMSQNRIRHLPVLDESGHLLGFVSMMAVMTAYVQQI